MTANDDRRGLTWDQSLLIGLGSGVFFLVLYALSRQFWLESLAISLLIAGSATVVGLLVGFLFGIPRTLQREGQQAKPDAVGSAEGPGVGVNTNLEQISDWLTKIIVGVGLVQLTTLPKNSMELGDYLATAFGEHTVPSPLILVILYCFGTIGFLLGYLWARLYLAPEFSRAEQAARQSPEYLEGIIHAFLYRAPPKGYQEAIKHGLEYNERVRPDNYRIWTYLACAYAQEFAYMSKEEPKPNQQVIDKAKANALAAILRTVEINPGTKHFLRSMWDPSQASPGEDDLKVFFDDPEFKKVLA